MGRKDVTFGGNKVSISGEEVKVGERAPNFRAVKQDLSTFDFYCDTDNKIKIISVAPSIDTKTCSLQTAFFNQKATELSNDVEIITITVDLPFAQKRFCVANGIENIQVVSDHKLLEFGERYGFILEGMRLLTRGVIIIDKDNIIKYIQYVQEVAKEPNYEEVLDELKKLL